MAGELLSIVGAVALLCLACELVDKGLRWLDRRRWRSRVRDRLLDTDQPAPEIPCVWPRLEPEVERLREKGAL